VGIVLCLVWGVAGGMDSDETRLDAMLYTPGTSWWNRAQKRFPVDGVFEFTRNIIQVEHHCMEFIGRLAGIDADRGPQVFDPDTTHLGRFMNVTVQRQAGSPTIDVVPDGTTAHVETAFH